MCSATTESAVCEVANSAFELAIIRMSPLHFEDLLAKWSQTSVIFLVINQASNARLTGPIELVLFQEVAQIVYIDELFTSFIAWTFQRKARRIVIHAANVVQ